MTVTIGSMKIIASKLQDALSNTVPTPRRNSKRKNEFPITISYDEQKSALCISESYHERASIEFDVPCEWPEPIQIDGIAFKRAINTYKKNDFLEIRSLPDSIEIINGVSKFKMPRLDGSNGPKIRTRAIPKNPRHRGKVIVKEEPFIGRVELDAIWGFSARMPVPHHQYPESRLPVDINENDNANDNIDPK